MAPLDIVHGTKFTVRVISSRLRRHARPENAFTRFWLTELSKRPFVNAIHPTISLLQMDRFFLKLRTKFKEQRLLNQN
jgi:hypothetical protein